ncbi:enoyl-CoA hydratase/isomerase family protein [Streptomyces melanosporofaciens]|uniref:enoyl-CoA hydratase/isomerase family protein n=1 Tax=Streptomyces melanosporofaciens TaxID=67327 RepID=UPI00142FCE95|nr:enoyl-CoA hydratase/isomerase family protein [Streptomyces melanosporofaciens]
MDDRVKLVVKGDVAEIRLNRPDRLNAVDDRMIEAFAAHLETLRTSEHVRVVVLTGAGRAFCAGGDLKRPPRTGPLEEQATVLRRQAATVERLAALPQITIAMLNGACAGLAVGWAAACSLRIVSDAAVINTAYLTAGLAGDFGVAWWLSRLLGPGVAADWMLRPRKIGAREAADRGFATIHCPAGELKATVDTVVRELCAIRPAALTGALTNLRRAEDIQLSAYLDEESARHVAVRHRAQPAITGTHATASRPGSPEPPHGSADRRTLEERTSR